MFVSRAACDAWLAKVAIRQARDKDFSEVERLQADLRRPYDEQPEYLDYAALQPNWAGSPDVSRSN